MGEPIDVELNGDDEIVMVEPKDVELDGDDEISVIYEASVN